MKTKLKQSTGVKLGAMAAPMIMALTLLFSGTSAQAANDTWNGGGANNNWNNSTNWGGSTPVANNLLFFGGSTRLGNTNNFAANTAFNGITFNNGAGAFTLWGNAIDLGGGITNNSANLQTINLNMLLTANIVIDAETGDLTIGGGISGTGFGLTKVGAGTLTLGTGNTYTGATTVNDGTLGMTGVAVGGNISSSSALALGGGTLSIAFTDNGTQTFNGTTVNTGASTISTSGSAHNKTGTLTLGTISRSTGSTLDFELNNTFGNIALSNSNTNGILGAYATISNADWATVNGNGQIATATYTTFAASGGSSTVNYSLSGNLTNTASQSINTLKLNNSAANQNLNLGGNTLTLSGGGLLFVGANNYTITNGTLTVSNAGLGAYELVMQDFGAGTLTNRAVIANNGAHAVAFTKAGAGTMVLAANNTYTGNTYINAGTVQVGSGGASGSLGAGNVVNDGSLDFDRSDSVTESGAISGSGDLSQIGGGTLTLGSANTYSGGTTLSAGQITLGADNALGSGGFNFAGGILNGMSRSFSVGAITLSQNSTINLDTVGGASTMTFSGIGTWDTSKSLTINNWLGQAGNAGTDDRIFIGNSEILSSLQLGSILIDGQAVQQLSTGELTELPEPTEWAVIIFAVGAVFVRFILPRLRRAPVTTQTNLS